MKNEEAKDLRSLRAKGCIGPFDYHFASFMEGLSGVKDFELTKLWAMVSLMQLHGHIALDLSAKNEFVAVNDGEDGEPEIVDSLADFKVLKPLLEKSGIVAAGGGKELPFILEDSRLYTYRYWSYEDRLARKILAACGQKIESPDTAELGKRLDLLFGKKISKEEKGKGESKEQSRNRKACVSALTGRFTVISGGPGTGKTYMVARILDLLYFSSNQRPATSDQKATDIRVALCAPTGKAAVRLKESLKQALESPGFPQEHRELFPNEAFTIHRLLGTRMDSPEFRHNADNPLPYDAVIVDEASMVDLALMAKLFDAFNDDTRVILLGDRDQLASVEAGSVLADICTSEKLNVIELKHSYRFEKAKGIGETAAQINRGTQESAEKTLQLLADKEYGDVWFMELPVHKDFQANIIKKSGGWLARYFEMIGKAQSGEQNFIDRVHEQFNDFKVLCALHRGPWGVQRINNILEKYVKQEILEIPVDEKWYAGRSVIVLVNDYSLNVFNGDVGIALPDPERDNKLSVCFIMPNGKIRKIPPSRLPDHESVWAMTVHKSQGSEFNRVLLVLPDRWSEVLARELLYTGVTRARKSVEIWGRKEVFVKAVTTPTIRVSGLGGKLR